MDNVGLKNHVRSSLVAQQIKDLAFFTAMVQVAAVVWFGSLAWEYLHAMGVAQKAPNEQRKNSSFVYSIHVHLFISILNYYGTRHYK